MTRASRTLRFSLALCWVLFVTPAPAMAQKEGPSSSPPNPGGLALAQGVICEGISDNTPFNCGVVFPTRIGQVVCFTSFDPVPAKTFVYHQWYYRDELITAFKLTLKPPRWATRSSIYLRETDKGPWRVEVTGPQGQVFCVLRFSITD